MPYLPIEAQRRRGPSQDSWFVFITSIARYPASDTDFVSQRERGQSQRRHSIPLRLSFVPNLRSIGVVHLGKRFVTCDFLSSHHMISQADCRLA